MIIIDFREDIADFISRILLVSISSVNPVAVALQRFFLNDPILFLTITFLFCQGHCIFESYLAKGARYAHRVLLGVIMRHLFFALVVTMLSAMASSSSFAGAYSDHLNENESLTKGQWLRSNNGQYTLVMQDDGNFVLYGRGRALWASNTEGRAVNNVIMQSDGNLVIYGYPQPIWASNTVNNPGAHLVMQDDGNAVIYIARKAIWATGTN
jgi:hypothetical protein